MAQRALLPLLLYRSLACLAARVVTLRLLVLLQLILLLGRRLLSPLLLLVVQLVLLLRHRGYLLQLVLLLGPCLSLLQVGADSRLQGALQASGSGSAPRALRSASAKHVHQCGLVCGLDWAVEHRLSLNPDRNRQQPHARHVRHAAT